MASTTTSNDRSFSRSSARSAAISMSMSATFPIQFDLYECLGDFGEPDGLPIVVSDDLDAVVVAVADASVDRGAVGELDRHEAVAVAAPMPGRGQGPVNAAGRDFQGVGQLAHDVGVIQSSGEGTRRRRDVVDGDAAVLIDRN